MDLNISLIWGEIKDYKYFINLFLPSMPLHEGEGFSATFSPFLTSSSRLEWFIWIGWTTLSVYTLSVLSASNSGQWCGQECIGTEVREFWYHKMGDPWKKKGLPGKLFFHTVWLWMSSGWIFSTFMALCLKTSLGTLAWFPLRRVASVGCCYSLTHHSWLALVSGRETSLAVLCHHPLRYRGVK